MVVIKDKDEIVRDGGDLVEQDCQNRLGGGWLRGLEHSHRPCSNIRRNRLQRSDEVHQKACGVVIPSSSDSQATGLPQLAIHSLTSVVFPNPAEAEMRVSLHPPADPCSVFSRSIRRGRRTT